MSTLEAFMFGVILTMVFANKRWPPDPPVGRLPP
jgi:hypothetical protein